MMNFHIKVGVNPRKAILAQKPFEREILTIDEDTTTSASLDGLLSASQWYHRVYAPGEDPLLDALEAISPSSADLCLYNEDPSV